VILWIRSASTGPDQGAASIVSTIVEAFRRLGDQSNNVSSEEDVKNKVVLPILRALGYEDADFNYEGRTGQGYVDVSVERYPTCIVVEAKAPRKRLDQQHEAQLETYVFHKHGRDRTTVAILTNGESFYIYSVTGALYKGSFGNHRIMSFRLHELGTPVFVSQIENLLGKQNNQQGAIPEAISAYQKKTQSRLGLIEAELRDLDVERQRVDARIQELQGEHTAILGSAPSSRALPTKSGGNADVSNIAAVPHILRLLKEAGARSRSAAKGRKWLDSQLINKVEGVNNNQAVSFGLIELKKKGVVDYDGKPIRWVWLI
jgi:predicted type IV restriction endonuclease